MKRMEACRVDVDGNKRSSEGGKHEEFHHARESQRLVHKMELQWHTDSELIVLVGRNFWFITIIQNSLG